VSGRTKPPLPVNDMTVDRWTRAGFLRLASPGTGRRREYPPGEIRAMIALDAFRRRCGTDPSGVAFTDAERELMSTIAEVARTHPPGTAHEIASPVPWIRHVVIVPEP
jgi:hypothetical protein